MGLFDINYRNLVTQQTPVRLRNSVQLAWLNALVSPVVYLYNLFYANRANNLYWLAHNGQVCFLQAALNDAFDDVSRRIYISDPVFIDPVYLYRRAELKPMYLYRRSESKPVFLYRRTETYEFGVNFIVHVPVSVVFNTAHMRALIDKYRLVSKNSYTIVTF